jgi:hypothetical protein
MEKHTKKELIIIGIISVLFIVSEIIYLLITGEKFIRIVATQ